MDAIVTHKVQVQLTMTGDEFDAVYELVLYARDHLEQLNDPPNSVQAKVIDRVVEIWTGYGTLSSS